MNWDIWNKTSKFGKCTHQMASDKKRMIYKIIKLNSQDLQ